MRKLKFIFVVLAALSLESYSVDHTPKISPKAEHKYVFLTKPLIVEDTLKQIEVTASDRKAANKYKNAKQLAYLYDNMVQQEIKSPEIVLAQVITETGYLTSKASKEYNLFGFMYQGRTMKFSSYEACISYYKWWQRKKFEQTPVDIPEANYYNFLDSLQIIDGRTISYGSEELTSYLRTIEPIVHKILLVYSEDYRNKLRKDEPGTKS